MHKPAPFPSTDTEEQKAIILFMSSIDPKQVKAEIKSRDKYPNIDGTVELVDSENGSFGKFDIQIRKIEENKRSYSCHSTLVAYSEISTLPVILVCVDTKNKRVYWRHITPTMPEYRPEQETFTIHFSDASDRIEADGIYFQKWTAIILEYRERISKYPLLRLEIADKLTLENVSPQDIRYCQQYIDTINRLFDNDFITIKKKYFPDVWKLGVGIYNSKPEWVSFLIYKIPFDKPSPLVCKLEGRPFTAEKEIPFEISSITTQRENLLDPDTMAKKFVFDNVKNVVEERILPIHGILTSTDIIFSFIDRFHSILGLPPNRDTFVLEEIDYSINRRLFDVCESVARQLSSENNGLMLINLDVIEEIIESLKVRPRKQPMNPIWYSIRSRSYPISSIFDSIKILTASGIGEIHRPFKKPSEEMLPGENWIWSGYKREDEIYNVQLALNNVIKEYIEFLSINRLVFTHSPYMDPNISIIYEYEPVNTSNLRKFPILCEHHIDNSSHRLPKYQIIVIDEGKTFIDVNEFPNIVLHGEPYTCNSSSRSDASILFSKIPMLNLIYKMLETDLSEHYEMGTFMSHYY
jgi:hypothetical protein